MPNVEDHLVYSVKPRKKSVLSDGLALITVSDSFCQENTGGRCCTTVHAAMHLSVDRIAQKSESARHF